MQQPSPPFSFKHQHAHRGSIPCAGQQNFLNRRIASSRRPASEAHWRSRYTTSLRNATLLFMILLMGCSQESKDERMARRYCSSCHLFPEPSLLDKETWERGVLPEMALRMGLDISRLPGTTPAELDEILRSLPGAPLMSEAEWQSIQAYYRENAPDTLSASPDRVKPEILRQFSVATVRLPIEGHAMLTFIKADSVTKKILAGSRAGKLFQLSRSLAVEDSFQLPGAPSDVLRMGEGLLVTCMGIMDPNDRYAGSLMQVPTNSLTASHEQVIDSLKRPVNTVQADLNNDGQDDLIVSAFGNFTGALLAFEKNGDRYERHVIHQFPGNRKTIVHDFNADGLQDLLVLITQGDERVALFTNRGNFTFSYEVLLKFPPVYGSSYFELVDFNADGHPDILYTNGDNADYSAILKPYHGVRIFLNDGRNEFEESWFYPMDGASMARASDFDSDGDVDVAAISFFPDFKHSPENGFLYFENRGGVLTPFQTPLAASGRWITMESTDIDDDGDTDLLLGALAFPAAVPESLLKTWRENRISLLLLRNKTR
jgi:hypothetical protein